MKRLSLFVLLMAFAVSFLLLSPSSRAADIGDSLDELTEDLAQRFLSNVQPLFVTFNMRSFDEATQEFVFFDIVRVSTAVAVFSDERGTFWLTVPGAFEFNDTSVRLLNTRFQLADGPMLELFKSVNNRDGYYTVLVEPNQRPIAPVTITTRATQQDRVGVIMTLQEDDFVGLQTTPRLSSNGTETYDFRSGWAGFSFEINCPTQGAVRGSPVFMYRPDPFVRPDEPFLLGGLLMDINTARVLAQDRLPVITDLGFATLLPSLEDILTPEDEPR